MALQLEIVHELFNRLLNKDSAPIEFGKRRSPPRPLHAHSELASMLHTVAAEENAMILNLKQLRRLTLVASLVTLGLVGCGMEEPDAAVTEGDSVETAQSALSTRSCVNIIQRHDGAALGYSNSNDQVFTDPAGRPPNTRFAWCMTFGGLDRSHFSPYDQQNTKDLDAYETSNDNRVVLRSLQNNPSQVWERIDDPFSDALLLRQLNTGRYLDAYTSGTRFAVTRSLQINDTQRWYIKSAGCTCDPG